MEANAKVSGCPYSEVKYLIAWELILNFPFISSANSDAYFGTSLLSSCTTNSPSERVRILKGVFSFFGTNIFLNSGKTSDIFSIAPGALSVQFIKSFFVNFLYSDLRGHGFFLRGVGDVDAALDLFDFFDGFHEDAIAQGLDFLRFCHDCMTPCLVVRMPLSHDPVHRGILV